MNTNGGKPVEEEYRSSQLYKTLTGSGIPAADKIAQGLGKAAQGLDSALETVAPVVKRGVEQAGNYRRAAEKPAGPQTTQTARAPGTGQANQAGQAPGNGGHSYQYQYSYSRQNAAPQAPQRPTQAGQRPQGVTPAPAPQMPQMKLVRKGSPVKFYLTGVAALIYALSFPLYEISHFIVFALVLCGVFLLSGRLFRGKKEFVPIQPEKPKEKPKPKPEVEKPSNTGNPEVDKLIDEGRESLKKLRAANDAIPDEALSEDIARMEKAAADIFRFIADHPEKASQIRKFMNYYLPTTLKLLNSYQRLASQSAKGENITSTMFNIAGMMHTVADAFEKQLDALFTDEAMDVSADISVFETLLKQEGFVEEKGEKL